MLKVSATTSQWIGYQIVYGLGLGCCLQAPRFAAQTVLPRKEVAIGAFLTLFGQMVFRTIFVSVDQNVLHQGLATRFARISGISISPENIGSAGTTGLFKTIPSQFHAAVLSAYNSSLRLCFLVAPVFACLSVIGNLGIEWRNGKEEAEGVSKNPASENAAGDGKNLRALSDEEGGR
ncbi:uncharacterized protein P174DRAFT_437600 [Aspergillus novofumigatus IBT 16806]|uniref:Uncharacterized protein n=1 Tax=Aspergillus novofumigatus (strain IBT 16806) TaxID=1392255 RepID=A0A2I1CNF1_ASPN1|nr:uncharacterized protein P174DRAFT_437600 [Aspergillus novofumigatus IBT 16806]PKX99154.1 hypothetical protein P174DRAFT_437600 [Aspergillus novofumigatus IBT 16806]